MAVSNLVTPPSGISSLYPNWTLLSTFTGGGSSTVTFSGLSGYKRYRLVAHGIQNSSASVYEFYVRINGVTAYEYSTMYQMNMSSTPSNIFGDSFSLDTRVYIGTTPANTGTPENRMNFDIEISDGDGTRFKTIKGFSLARISTTRYVWYPNSWLNTTNSITSISLINGDTFATATSPAGIYLYGAN